MLRELTHRCKNLLAVIHAIARQTASRTRSVEDFLDRFSARLVAIGCSHDLLIADNWHGASLRMLVEQQLGEHADRFGEQIAIEGEDVMLKPEAVQNSGSRCMSSPPTREIRLAVRAAAARSASNGSSARRPPS